MVSVRLDVTGRLTSFKAVPPARLQSGDSIQKADWNAVFLEAGLALNNFETIEPKRRPSVHSDEIREWKGTLADFPDIPVRINGAGLGGKVVEFSVVPVWKEPSEVTGGRQGLSGEGIFSYVLFWVILLTSVLVARYNLKHGRGDLSGAVKLGGCCFLLYFAASVLASDYLPVANSHTPVTVLATFALESGLVLLIFYLAMEPYVRRSWPEGLVSWNRLLYGEFRNPMIGRDLLIGMTCGGLILIVQLLVKAAVVSWYPDALFNFFTENYFFVFNGPSRLASGVSGLIYWSLLNSFFWLFMLILWLKPCQ